MSENCSCLECRKKYGSQLRWDRDFLALAQWIALRRSKDPSTKVGAVITTPDNRVVSMGYNGLPQGVLDLPERYADRELKYKMIVHAERNAILFARRDLTGCTLYTWPMGSCSVCSGMVIQAGIKRVVAPATPTPERWAADVELSAMMFREAGVSVEVVNDE